VTLPAPARLLDPETFLAWERDQLERHGYLRGDVFGMSGGSMRHSLLASRVIARLDEALRGQPCDVYTSDLLLGVADDHLVYADAVVVCPPFAFRAGTTDVVTNPRVLIEVLSKSTEAYDRGDKQAGYLAMPSVEHYLLVAQRSVRAELYTRQPDDSFRFTLHGPGSIIPLVALDLRLPVDALYEAAFDVPGDEVGPAAAG
jgi:Uma2 family endonuclease